MVHGGAGGSLPDHGAGRRGDAERLAAEGIRLNANPMQAVFDVDYGTPASRSGRYNSSGRGMERSADRWSSAPMRYRGTAGGLSDLNDLKGQGPYRPRGGGPVRTDRGRGSGASERYGDVRDVRRSIRWPRPVRTGRRGGQPFGSRGASQTAPAAVLPVWLVVTVPGRAVRGVRGPGAADGQGQLGLCGPVKIRYATSSCRTRRTTRRSWT